MWCRSKQQQRSTVLCMYVCTKNATQAKNSIDCMHCFSHACFAYFGFLIATQSVVLRVLHTTALKAHVGLWKQTKGRFPSCRTQCNGRNAGQKKPQRTQCMHTKNATHERIESIACVTLFACMRCVFRFFDWVANHASVALHLLRTTAWKPHVGLWVGLCDTVVYISLMSQWISSQTQCSSE